MSPVLLADAGDARQFGGKAAQLAHAIRAGLPVPEGVALSWPVAGAVTAGDPAAATRVAESASALGPSLAVRSSAVGEDSEAASFAGQHLTRLNVASRELAGAVAAVSRSVGGAPARAYRRRLGVPGEPRAGVVVQRMVEATVAGVLFRPHPVTGADEVVIEAAWGLGDAVVGGLVTPDLFRLNAAGGVIERRLGGKDVEVVAVAGGGTAVRAVGGERAAALCLDDGQLERLYRLVATCERVFGGSQDLEWAFAGEALWLLQRRAVTRGRG